MAEETRHCEETTVRSGGIFAALHLMGVYYPEYRKNSGAGEMAQWLSTLAPFPEGPVSIPSAHMAPHNHLSVCPAPGFQGQQACMWCRDTHVDNIPIHVK